MSSSGVAVDALVDLYVDGGAPNLAHFNMRENFRVSLLIPPPELVDALAGTVVTRFVIEDTLLAD